MPAYREITKRISARVAIILVIFILGITASGLNPEMAAAADPRPDLIVQNIALSPEEPSLGDTVTISVTVKNQGTDGAGASHAACYIDNNLLASKYISPLGAGMMTTVIFTWQAQPGIHTIQASADPSNLVTEADETNNTKVYTFSTLAADLIIQSISWSPENPSKGDSIVFSITIKNQGSGKSPVTSIHFYIDGNSRGYQDISTLNPGSTITRTYNWVAQAGQHPVKATVDEMNHVKESDETNNEHTVTFSTLPPDLIIESITWSPENPSKNDNVTFTAVVKNQGTGSSDSCHMAYYIDGHFKSSISVSPIAAGSSANVTFTWTALSETHEIKTIIDFYEKLTESDETNNENMASFMTLTPDLIVTDITWSPVDAAVGDIVTFTVTIKNQGSGTAEASRAGFYIGSYYTGYLDIPGILAGAEATTTFEWLAKGGTHIVSVVANHDNRLVENNKDNNKLSVTIPIIPPDLVITSIVWSPENPTIGDIVSFTVTIKNQGGGKAENFRVGYYLDGELLTSAYVGWIISGASTNTTYTWKSQSGIHTFKAIVDYDMHIPENNEDNNENSVTITPHMPDLTIDAITWSPPDVPAGGEVTFNIKIRNQGTLEANPSRITYYIDGSPAGYRDLGQLDAGATVTEHFSWVASAGPHTIDIVTDSGNQVAEIDEANNTKVVNLPPPDLTIQDITWSPLDASVGDTVTFTVTVMNQGNGKANSSQITCYVDGLPIGSQDMPAIGSVGSVSRTFDWVAEADTHKIMISADTGNRITETDETNNEKEITFATLTPDLAIQDIIWFIDDPLISDDITFVVTIKNQGSGTATGSQFAYSIDGAPNIYEDIEQITAGDTVAVTFFSILAMGPHTLKIGIDTNNEVVEIDETNNEEVLSFNTIAPDLVVKTISWSPLDAAVGDTITITVTMENQGKAQALNTRLDLYIDGSSAGYAEIDEIDVGAEVTREFTWTAVEGLHEISTFVDMPELVLECNETNNTKTREISLLAPEAPVKQPARPVTGSTDKGFIGKWWWLLIIAAVLSGGAAFLSMLKSFKKN